MSDMIYQFKILLQGSNPPIWRRIQVPDSYSFYGLHVAIQDSMGWEDYHLHEFNIQNPRASGEDNIGIPDDSGWGGDILPGWKKKLSYYFSLQNPTALYRYDFGDGWEHLITLEKIFPAEEKTTYPQCIKGKRACPPEDCGGVWGYKNLLEILDDPKHEEYKCRLEWLGDNFDAEKFDPKEVVFEDPKKRLKLLLKSLA